jgi:DNA-binding SARP family transcriptional activator
VQLRILGPLRVQRGDVEVDAGPPQQRCLLALLLARAGHPVSVDDLIRGVWDTAPPGSAVNIVHKYVGVVRRRLEPGLPPRSPGVYIARHGNGYRFTAGPETLDLLRFRRLVAEAKDRAGRDDPDDALDRYVAALRLSDGPAAGGFAETPEAQATFARIDGEFRDAVLDAAAIAVRRDRPSLVAAPLRRAAEMDPLDEPVHASLMVTLAGIGHRAEALSVYRAVCERLSDDLGIDPGPHLQDAYRRIVERAVPSAPPGLSARHAHRDRIRRLSTERDVFERRLASLPWTTAEAVLMEEIIELCDRLPHALAVLATRLGAPEGEVT